jgi:hypothetical protein
MAARNRPPFRVTLLIWLVLLLTAWNVLRTCTVLAWYSALKEFSAHPSPLLILSVSLLLSAGGLAVLWGIWQNKPWTVKLLLVTAAAYTIWYWCERLIWQAPRPNGPFAVILNLLALVFIFFTTKSLAREAYDRESPNQKTE